MHNTALKKSVCIPAVHIPDVVRNSVLSDIDNLSNDLSNFFEKLRPIAEQHFTMMKNKKVWFDRLNVALYPRFEAFELPQIRSYGDEASKYSIDFEGFHFVGINRIECMHSFFINSQNPYLQNDGTYKNFPSDNELLDEIITCEIWDDGKNVWKIISNGYVVTTDDKRLRTLIPIHRMQRDSSKIPTFIDVIWLWIKNGLLPEGLDNETEEKYKQLLIINHYLFNQKSVIVDKLENDMQNVFRRLKEIANKRFVKFKNKSVWFDKENSAIYPQFDKFGYPYFRFCDTSAANYTCDYEGFKFRPIKTIESIKSFVRNIGNPYLNSSNQFNNSSASSTAVVLTGELSPGINYCFYCNTNGYCSSSSSSSNVTLIPIHRFKNYDSMNFVEAIAAWIDNGLIPEGLSEETEKAYQLLLNDEERKKGIREFEEKYNQSIGSTNIIGFDKFSFANDIFNGIFTDVIFNYNFNLPDKLEKIISKSEKLTVSPENIRNELLNCDKVRANLQPYNEDRLTDINLGHWELYESANDNDIEINLPEGKPYVARPPQMDVIENGTCAIDFGTKSTVVVCRSQDARLLRVGKGNLAKEPTADDYENPTVIEIRDLEGFMKAYNGREGRPFTQWEQITVSHQASEAIFQNDDDSSIYYSVFGELKQWANAKGKRLLLRDRKGKIIELKPYDELTEEDFDPIQLYAYYLGLYINNMHNRIYLDYLLSFPVTYEQKVREHIRQSFEIGIKKSLPPSLLHDKEAMEMFRVSAGASEPAAYAISALEEYGLQPQKIDGKISAPVNYAVFDFGGGTTDFDFGTEEIPEDGRRKFVIRRFGAGGDSYLGGENILELMAYEVYQDNLEEMRKYQIPIVLPPTCKRFAGSETLVFDAVEASQQAYMNIKRLSREMRCIWERKGDYIKKFDQPTDIILFSSQIKDGTDKIKEPVKIKVAVNKLEKCIEDRIRHGVENFFTAMMHAFDGKPFSPANPIHIFLAGNSCKSAFVRPLFNEYIKKYEQEFSAGIHEEKGQEKDTHGTFILHPPLGIEWDDNESTLNSGLTTSNGEASVIKETPETVANGNNENEVLRTKSINKNFDQLRTGKTGVAFGLLRTRIGGRDVKLIDEDTIDNEIPFPFYLGDIDRDNKFHVRIGRKIPYGEWIWFAYADVPEFELYYTKEANSLKGNFTESDVARVRCRFNAEECSDDDDVGVYLRKISPDTIEYAIGHDNDFASEEFQGNKYTKQLII